jgi:hypothetical protein
MALKDVANASYSKTLVTVVGVGVQGTVVDTGTPSTKVFAPGGQGVLKDGYGVSVTNITDPGAGATIPDPGPKTDSFSATATKVKADGVEVLRKDDETGIINATPQIPGTPPTPWPVQFKYQITNAGQIKVKAE